MDFKFFLTDYAQRSRALGVWVEAIAPFMAVQVAQSMIFRCSEFLLYRPSVGEYTQELKRKAHEELLRLILRTREKTAEVKKTIEANNIFVC
jgi:hypothetical protein